jgi:hypothetical protein
MVIYEHAGAVFTDVDVDVTIAFDTSSLGNVLLFINLVAGVMVIIPRV